MPLPLSWYSITVNDHTLKGNGQPETTSMQIPVTTLSPANVAAQITLANNLQTALAAITLGVFAKSESTYARNLLGVEPAASPLAQRENKWLMRYHDATTFQKFQVSIGTADLTLINLNTEFLDLTVDEGLALKTAFEAVVVSPADSTHATVLDSVQFVGRNT